MSVPGIEERRILSACVTSSCGLSISVAARIHASTIPTSELCILSHEDHCTAVPYLRRHREPTRDRGRDSIEKILMDWWRNPPPVAQALLHQARLCDHIAASIDGLRISQPTLQAHSLFSPSSSGGISSSPESAITTVLEVFPDWLPTASTALTTFIDSSSDTLPKTT